MTRKNRTTLLLASVCYLVSYATRSNLSTALPAIMQSFDLETVQAGLLGTLFFWVYAFGQLMASFLVSKIAPKPLAAGGLAVSGLANIAFAFAPNYGMLLAAWALNALALSQVWSPLVRIAAADCRPEAYATLSTVLNLPTTLGYLIQWGIMGPLLSRYHWRWAFIVPGVLALLYAAFFLFAAPAVPRPEPAPRPEPHEPQRKGRRTPLWAALFNLDMLLLALCLVLVGAVRESINLWAPTLLQAAHPAASGVLNGLIPLLSTVGLLSTGWLFAKQSKRLNGTLLLLLGLNAAAALWVALLPHYGSLLVGQGLMLAILYGTSAMMTTLLPLRAAKNVDGSRLSGIYNFLAYLGASLGGVLSGVAADTGSVGNMRYLWLILSAAAVLIFCGGRLAARLVRRRAARLGQRGSLAR